MKRLMIYDNSSLKDALAPSDYLATSWKLGSSLYKTFRMLDKVKGVSSWEKAIDWLIEETKTEPASMIQFWGHGYPGYALIGHEFLSAYTFDNKVMGEKLRTLGKQLVPETVFWFRTCGTIAGRDGHEFAERFSSEMNCTVAGHTYLIGLWQSGLHTLQAWDKANWPITEGINKKADGTISLKASHPFAQNTITCLSGNLPVKW